jgi:hypothetical protein
MEIGPLFKFWTFNDNVFHLKNFPWLIQSIEGIEGNSRLHFFMLSDFFGWAINRTSVKIKEIQFQTRFRRWTSPRSKKFPWKNTYFNNFSESDGSFFLTKVPDFFGWIIINKLDFGGPLLGSFTPEIRFGAKFLDLFVAVDYSSAKKSWKLGKVEKSDPDSKNRWNMYFIKGNSCSSGSFTAWNVFGTEYLLFSR